MPLLKYLYEDLYPTYQRTGVHNPIDYWCAPAERSFLRSNSKINENEAKTQVGKDGFQAIIDVEYFHPYEIAVTTKNNSIFVHAKHDEKPDEHGLISREFTRRYELPEGFKTDDVTSSISTDGVLTVKCPPIDTKKETEEPNVRYIEVQQTGPQQ